MTNNYGCMHRRFRVEYITTGTRSFYGEVFDDIREEAQIHCLDCGGIFSEQEIRETWTGYSPFVSTLDEQDEIR